MEEWKDIIGYEGLYKISSFGRIMNSKNIIMKPFLHKNKYLRIGLCKESKKINHRVHRLVAIHFIPNIDNKPQVNHIDLDPANNNVSNLEWVTGEENIDHYLKSNKYKIINQRNKS